MLFIVRVEYKTPRYWYVAKKLNKINCWFVVVHCARRVWTEDAAKLYRAARKRNPTLLIRGEKIKTQNPTIANNMRSIAWGFIPHAAITIENKRNFIPHAVIIINRKTLSINLFTLAVRVGYEPKMQQRCIELRVSETPHYWYVAKKLKRKIQR